MNTPLSEVLKRFNVLSSLANEEGEYSKNLIIGPGQDLTYQSPATRELLEEPQPCHAALGAFLSALPAEVVWALTALMYSGRDKEPDAIDYWKDLHQNFPTKGRAIEAILEKPPRSAYIRDGIALLPPSITLNAIPNLIATK